LVALTEQAAKQEKAEAKLAAVLKATGNAIGYKSEELGQEALKMQTLTGISDEVILNAQAVLATFKNVKRVMFGETTQAALDMTTVLSDGELSAASLNTTMIQLGTAMNDPINGLNGLIQAGITFDKNQKDRIESLIKENKLFEAQEIIIKELKDRFGGAAEAQGRLFSGQINAANASIDNLLEELGYSITKNVDVNNKISAVMSGAESLQRFAHNNQEYLNRLVGYFVSNPKMLLNLLFPTNFLRTLPDTIGESILDAIIQTERLEPGSWSKPIPLPPDQQNKNAEATSQSSSRKVQAPPSDNTAASKKTGIESLLAKQTTWSEQGIRIFKDFVTQIDLILDKGFVSVVEGDFEALDKLVESCSDNMVKSVAGAVSKMGAQWVTSEVAKLFEIDTEAEEQQKVFDEKAIKSEQERLLKSGEFFNGIKAAYLDLLRDQTTWSDQSQEIFKEFVTQTSRLFEQGLISVIKGDFENLDKLLEGFLDNMIQSVANAVGQMATQWATNEVASLMGIDLSRLGMNKMAGTGVGASGGLMNTALSGYGMYNWLGGSEAATGAAAAAVGAVPLGQIAGGVGLEGPFLGASSAEWGTGAAAAGGLGSAFMAYLPYIGIAMLALSMIGGGNPFSGLGTTVNWIGDTVGGVAETVGGFVEDVVGGIGDFFGFASGTAYIERDMIARVHQGERILSREDNKALIAAVGRLSDGGSAGGNQENIHFHFHGDVYADDGSKDRLAEDMYFRMKKVQRREMRAGAGR